MIEIFILLIFLLFSIFLVLGVLSHVNRNRSRWIYYLLSIICLLGVVFLLFFGNWNTTSLRSGVKVDLPTTEKPSTPRQDNGTNSGNENPPENEHPPAEEPSEEEPSNPAPTPSEKIIVPENKTVDYKVVKGDTLFSIAKRANVTVEKIKQWNSLPSDVIYVGQILKLYGKNAEPIPPAEPPKQEPTPTTASSVIISNGSLQQKKIALTFDAGSDAVGIGILDVLKKHNVKATFFLTGKWVVKYPSLAKRIADEGHDIGNHSYSHPDAVKTTTSAFKKDIIKAEEAIKSVTGRTPQPYFRFPFGSYNTAALKTAGEAGYPYSIQWSLDTIDWQQPASEVIISRIKTGASNGDIILMHIGGINTPAAVDNVIPWLKAQGYQLVPLSDLLE
ncbi:polysaccharide deacetylase family protein [Neobacillus drentensis]|uniref:polysaccharide deacetylase family protein n=1 Tax=Neobacillus drentensis TaxID=220684 RepID=UPI000824C8B5|nr:polysaccharide deacetylase family protein [Neobacillus drentensis]